MRVFDTSAVLAALERRESPARRELLGELRRAASGQGDWPAVSAVTVAEMLRGAQSEADAVRLAAALAVMQVLPVDEHTARAAAALGAAADARSLRRAERPGIADALVAATALEAGVECVTCDGGFRAFPASVRVVILPPADA